VEIARTRLTDLGAADRLDAVVGSAYEPPEGPYDLVTLTDVLEHLEDPRACLRALRTQMAPGGLLVISTPNRRSLPGARRWMSEHGVPGIKLSLAPIDNWQSWVDLESHAAAAGMVPVSKRGIFFRPGGKIGSQIGRVYKFASVRTGEKKLSATPVGRFGFYIVLGFRPLP
jgi:SAM-dependent methyltransferase